MITRSELDDMIASRVSEDESFRRKLIRDPHRVIHELTNIQVAESVDIFIHEDSPTELHLVIPGEFDLSISDLDLVSGGMQFSWCDTESEFFK